MATGTITGTAGWRERSRTMIDAITTARDRYIGTNGSVPTHVGVPATWRTDLVDAIEVAGMRVRWLDRPHDEPICWREAPPTDSVGRPEGAFDEGDGPAGEFDGNGAPPQPTRSRSGFSPPPGDAKDASQAGEGERRTERAERGGGRE